MIVPFDCEDLFELNDNLQPQFDGEVIVIDNVFKNFQNILNITQNLPVERWKGSSNTRNFKDYYDCRVVLSNNFPQPKKTQKRLGTLLNITDYFFKLNGNITCDHSFQFNYFKHKKLNVSQQLQHSPHVEDYFNCIFFLDIPSNGGTAIYENINIPNNEHINLMRDISDLKIDKIIESLPNRCVIFRGDRLHGGYIKNHNTYYHSWRINLVHFFKPKN